MFAFFFSQQTKQISSFVFWENLRHANPALGSIWPLVNDFFQNFHKWGLSSGNKKVTLLFAFLCIFRYSRDSQSQTYSPTFPRKTRNYKEGQWIARKKAIKMVIQWDQTRFYWCKFVRYLKIMTEQDIYKMHLFGLEAEKWGITRWINVIWIIVLRCSGEKSGLQLICESSALPWSSLHPIQSAVDNFWNSSQTFVLPKVK